MSGRSRRLSQPKNLQEFFCRDIGEGRAGFRRARAGGDEIEALQAADDVAADFLADEARQTSARVAGCR